RNPRSRRKRAWVGAGNARGRRLTGCTRGPGCSRPSSGSWREPAPHRKREQGKLIVRVEAGGGADVVGGEAAAQEQVGGLVPGRAVVGGDGAEAAADEVAGVLEPVAVVVVHR